jgi:hypothetical protein
MGSADKEEILSYLQELAARINSNTLTVHQVNEDGQISSATIIHRFGGFSEALIQAGLKPGRVYKRNPETMLKELADLTSHLGRVPSKTEINKNLSCNARHYEKEFGSVTNAITSIKDGRVNSEESQSGRGILAAQVSLTRSKSRRRYGPTIDFRGLRHAPINELGVVFLFGMLAEELGFVVESVQTGFPDCDAKLKRSDGSYEGVRIEFEYNSKSFERHGHNPDECDLIVCWLHDWTDAPLEVIELSSLIQRL